MEEKTSFGTKVGRFIGNLFVTCVAACFSAALIALTVRFIVWLF
jgi:tetrahydromethanopterin S-methyltransferase subunit G